MFFPEGQENTIVYDVNCHVFGHESPSGETTSKAR